MPPPAAVACDPALVQPLIAEPPVQGGLVQPATAVERTALAQFLTGEAEARAWGRAGWSRVAAAKAECDQRTRPMDADATQSAER